MEMACKQVVAVPGAASAVGRLAYKNEENLPVITALTPLLPACLFRTRSPGVLYGLERFAENEMNTINNEWRY